MRGLLIFLVFIAAAPLPVAAATRLGATGGAPTGFEAMEAPELNMVNVYYGGRLLGNFSAHTTPSTIAFDAPALIVSAIPAITDTAQITALLARPMPSNVGKLCGPKSPEDCGHLAPDTVGVIYNENQQEAELFINAAYLSLMDDNAERYLPLPERQFSSVYGFNGAVAGGTENSTDFALSNESIFAFGEGRANLNVTASDENLRLNTASAGIERNGWAGFGGLLRTHQLQLAPDRDMAGLSISTSDRTLLDSRKNEGNDIILFLPRRAYVSIYREGQLYSSRAYEAGNQKIDTSELPEGSYNITLRIQEAGEPEREEKRLFAKSPDLPAPDRPNYYAQAGVLREQADADSTIPQFTGDPILRFGTDRRISDNTGISLGAIGLDDRAALETSVFYIDTGLQMRATALASTKGDKGVQSSVIYISDAWNAALDARRIWAADNPNAVDAQSFFYDTTQASLSLGYQFSAYVSTGLRASYASMGQDLSNFSIGPYMQWFIWQQGESDLTLSADAARIDGRDQGAALLRFTKRFGDYGMTTTTGLNYGRAGGNPYGNARLWHEDRTPDNVLLLGGGVQGDPRNQSANADADWRGKTGRVRGGIQQAISGEQRGTTYGGNFSVNAAQLDDHLSFGGDDNDRSAVIIESDGSANADLRIFINGTERNTIKVGQKQAYYLAPFHTYTIRVLGKSDQLLDIDSSAKRVTLYPGNVTKLNWRVDPLYVIAAQIVDTDSQPLAQAKLQDDKTISTSDTGRLQAERKDLTQLIFETEFGTCRVSLPAQKPVNGVLVYRKPLICQPINQTADRSF